MPIGAPDRIAMSQRERDVLTVVRGLLHGERSQAGAARLLGLSTRQVRRLRGRLEAHGDAALVYGLRGRPSNHRLGSLLRAKVLEAYRRRYADFGPTLASEKLAEEGLHVCPQTLRRRLLAAGLWQRRRHRDPHHSRRRARERGLARNLIPGYHGPRWTRAQLRLLGKEPDEVVAVKVGRAPNAVRLMRRRLGMPNPLARGWTEEEDRLLRELPPAEAARRTGRTLGAVYARRHYLGLRDGRRYNGRAMRQG